MTIRVDMSSTRFIARQIRSAVSMVSMGCWDQSLHREDEWRVRLGADKKCLLLERLCKGCLCSERVASCLNKDWSACWKGLLLLNM